MIKSDGLDYIRRGFCDEQNATWRPAQKGDTPGELEPGGDDQRPLVNAWLCTTTSRTFEALYEQLVDDHGLGPMSAVDILESAYRATMDELQYQVEPDRYVALNL